MKLKHAVMLGTLGRYADRFHCYQPDRSLAEKIAAVQGMPGVAGIEIVYPQELSDVDQTLELVRRSGLAVSAVNLNLKSEDKWRGGSFTSADQSIRAEALAYAKRAMDLAVELRAGMVTCCPLIDGHNYNFEADYIRQWQWLEEGVSEAARHRPEVKLSLEYKLNECRNYNILSDMGRTLYLCEKLGLPNVGVTMDVGHALIAKETPAEALCMAIQAGRLFYLHLNDNGREWDWDMLPGSVNYWDLLEVLYYVQRLDWQGWIAYDVFTRNGDPVETAKATLDIVEATAGLLDKVGEQTLQDFIKDGTPARTFTYLVRSLT